MKPVGGEVPAAAANGLGNFVFVVREDEVDAAGMEVEVVAEIFLNHGRAFEVPAGAAFAPGRVPSVFAVFGAIRLPENEVAYAVFLVFIGVGAFVLGFPELQFSRVEVGEFAVFGEGGDAEIHGAIVGGVGVIFRDESLDHGDLLGDVLDGGGLDVRFEAVEGGAIAVKFFRPLGGEIFETLSVFLGIADGFIVHVGDVADVEGGRASGFEGAAEYVLEDEGAEISDVCGAVNGGAAAVEAIRVSVLG